MAASLKILVTNTYFSVTLATSWLQIQTLDNNKDNSEAGCFWQPYYFVLYSQSHAN